MSRGGERERTDYAWVRRPPEPSEKRRAGAMALAAGAAVGGVVYYLARTLLARDRIGLRPEVEGREE